MDLQQGLEELGESWRDPHEGEEVLLRLHWFALKGTRPGKSEDYGADWS